MKWTDIAHVKPDYDRCLVFSDWLEDQGDPLSLRQAQVLRQLVRLERWPITWKFTEVTNKLTWFARTINFGSPDRRRWSHWLPAEAVPDHLVRWWAKPDTSSSISWLPEHDITYVTNPVAECLQWTCSEVEPSVLASFSAGE